MNISNTLCFKIYRKKNNTPQNTAPGNSVDRISYSNCWAVIGASLQSNLDNWTVFQELCDGILEGRVDLEIRSQVIGVQTQMESCNHFGIQLGVLVLRHTNNLSSTVQ